MYVRTVPADSSTPKAPRPPLTPPRPPWPSFSCASAVSGELPASRSSGLTEALAAARELTLTTLRLTRDKGREETMDLAADLRRTTAAVALGLEGRTALSLLAALHALWRTAEHVDRAEREGLLDLGEAMELLLLGSRVEIPLVSFLRRCGLERSLVSSGEG